MTQEVKDYATRKILESGIRMVPGHYPGFRDKEHVDMWLKMSRYAFDEYFGEEDKD